MARNYSDQYKPEVSRIVSQDINAHGFIHDFTYSKAEPVLGQSRRTLIIHFTHYEEVEERTDTMKFKVTIELEAEEGVTADQIKETIQNGDCGDFDKLVADLGKVKVKPIAHEAELSE